MIVDRNQYETVKFPGTMLVDGDYWPARNARQDGTSKCLEGQDIGFLIEGCCERYKAIGLTLSSEYQMDHTIRKDRLVDIAMKHYWLLHDADSPIGRFCKKGADVAKPFNMSQWAMAAYPAGPLSLDYNYSSLNTPDLKWNVTKALQADNMLREWPISAAFDDNNKLTCYQCRDSCFWKQDYGTSSIISAGDERQYILSSAWNWLSTLPQVEQHFGPNYTGWTATDGTNELVIACKWQISAMSAWVKPNSAESFNKSAECTAWIAMHAQKKDYFTAGWHPTSAFMVPVSTIRNEAERRYDIPISAVEEGFKLLSAAAGCRFTHDTGHIDYQNCPTQTLYTQVKSIHGLYKLRDNTIAI